MTEAALQANFDGRVRDDIVHLYFARWRGALGAVTLFTMAAAVAGGDHVSKSTATAWCVLSCLNYLGQAFVSWRMERSLSLSGELQRWMPWLLVSIAIGGLLWGAVPWLLFSAAVPMQLFACLFNLMLFYAVVNAPSTRAMIFAATSIVIPTILALVVRDGIPHIALGGAVAFGLVLLHALRVQAAVQKAQKEHHIATDLLAELSRHQKRLVEVENERTLLLERQRLMRDMHDGLGSTLISSLVAVERGLIAHSDVAELLRDCVDDLRAVIDSLEPVEHDLVALLAMLRYRLGRRLDAAGIALDWHMGDIPTLGWLGPSEALHVMRAVQETLANVVKHAHATRVRVSADHDNGMVQVCIADDGCGFDTHESFAGRGLRQLSQRALHLGGKVDIQSHPGSGTSIILRIPVDR
jgi:signal transduction histidine kinase